MNAARQAHRDVRHARTLATLSLLARSAKLLAGFVTDSDCAPLVLPP
ncbi:hypothetical protein VSR68_19630 [Paraburkholderia phymatum]